MMVKSCQLAPEPCPECVGRQQRGLCILQRHAAARFGRVSHQRVWTAAAAATTAAVAPLRHPRRSFVLTLKKGRYTYQFGQYAWTHMILMVRATQRCARCNLLRPLPSAQHLQHLQPPARQSLAALGALGVAAPRPSAAGSARHAARRPLSLTLRATPPPPPHPHPHPPPQPPPNPHPPPGQVVFLPSSFFVSLLFEGLIWFLLPTALVIVNDIMAYLAGAAPGFLSLFQLNGFFCTGTTFCAR